MLTTINLSSGMIKYDQFKISAGRFSSKIPTQVLYVIEKFFLYVSGVRFVLCVVNCPIFQMFICLTAVFQKLFLLPAPSDATHQVKMFHGIILKWRKVVKQCV